MGRYGCLLFLMLATATFAQDSLHYESIIPGHAIRFSPFHLLNFYPTIQLSYEKKINGKYTAHLEGGYVLHYNSSNDTRFKDKRGVKIKFEPRYYFWGRVDRTKLYYAAVELYWNAINFDRAASRTECFDLDCTNQFIRYYDYKIRYRENGIGLKLGIVKYFSDFLIDVNSGWMIRNIHYYYPEAEGQGWETEWIFFAIPNERDRIVPCPVIGIRIGYLLN